MRKRRFKFGRLLAPLIVIAMIAAAFVWPVSRARLHAVAPIGAAMDAAANASDVVSLRQAANQRERAIADLQQRVAGLQSDVQSRDKQISALTTQANQSDQLAQAAQPAQGAAAGGKASPAPSEDVKLIARTAKIWDEMDPEAAAKIVQRLPDAYVARIFAEMDPDQVAEILGALPPKTAARLTATRTDPAPAR
ncbi:hypothetical protein EPN42_06005 [bacterium]|nr:MAG: hypothetical protein EPN42_06005 [bacterium]